MLLFIIDLNIIIIRLGKYFQGELPWDMKEELFNYFTNYKIKKLSINFYSVLYLKFKKTHSRTFSKSFPIKINEKSFLIVTCSTRALSLCNKFYSHAS